METPPITRAKTETLSKKVFKIKPKMPAATIWGITIKKLKTPKTNNLINLSLYSDYNPKTTTPGLGFKNKDKAIYTINKIKNRNIKYQVNVIATMLGRAKNHPHKTKDMNKAIKEFEKWMKNYKKTT